MPEDNNLHRRQTKSNNNQNYLSRSHIISDSNEKGRGTQTGFALQPARFFIISGLLVFAIVAINFQSSEPRSTILTNVDGFNQSNASSHEAIASRINSAGSPPLGDLSLYENCTVRTPPARSVWTTKPLWFPSYPTAINDNIIKNLVSTMTGLKAGAKSFYASSKSMGLRQCKAKTETAACLLIHPMVEMKPGPDSKIKEFNSKIVILMRNPILAMPAFLNDKRIKYGKKQGQTPIDEWRRGRDTWVQPGMWEEWKKQLMAWKNLEKYNVGMYLVWEHLMDPSKGPTAVARLAEIVKAAGFPTAPPEDMACLWFQCVGGIEALEHYQKYCYEFTDYLPGYTESQKQYFVNELRSLTEDFKDDDDDLSEILADYHRYAQNEITLDSPFLENSSAPS